MAYHRGLALAAAAAMSVFADMGLSRAAAQPVRRGQVDLSSPYIPPARVNPTVAEREAIRCRETKAEQKRARKAARLQRLVASGGYVAA